MPQTATIKTLPVAFAMLKAMRAEGVELERRCRSSAPHALAEQRSLLADHLAKQQSERGQQRAI
jgi:hypothetical protein